MRAQENVLERTVILYKKKYKTQDILENLLPQQGVNVAYHDNIIPLKKEIEFGKIKETTVKEILSRICHNENLDYINYEGQLMIRYYDRPEREYKYAISGLVEDAASGEALIGATVYIKNIETGLATNGYGFYAFSLPKGKYDLLVSFIGYHTVNYAIELNKDFQFNFQLVENSVELDNVVVEEQELFDVKAQNILLSSNKLDMDMASQIPYIAEVDVFQSSMLLPGISNVGEGVSGVNVRGSAADANLIMLDEAVIYNSNHFFGLVSVFNPDAVKDVEILKGDLPAKYGGRTSSVMHIRQKEGNDSEFHLSGGLGLITSRLMIEGPIMKGNANYLLSARSTFWDLILRNTKSPTLANTRVSFQDINTKVKFDLNSKNKIYFSGYFGADANQFGIDAIQKWGNRVMSVRWNKIHKSKHFMNLTSYFSQYEYRVEEEREAADYVGSSSITDIAAKFDMTSYYSPKNIFEYGGEIVTHFLNPGERIPGPGSAENAVRLDNELGIESSIYLSNERHFGDLSVSLGARYSNFVNSGRSDMYTYQPNQVKSLNTRIDTVSAGEDNAKTFYQTVLPRLSMKYQLNPNMSLKVGHFGSVQYMHLLSNTQSPASSDLWQISGEYLLPTTMLQTTIGLYQYVKKFDMDLSLEVYYRKIQNVVDYKNGANLLFNESIETEILNGNERAYGMEVFLRKKFGKLTGWLGYTLSKSERQVNGDLEEEKINGGAYFPTNYDRTHDIAITGIYQLTPYLSLSSSFVYYTGRPYSFPSSKYQIDGLLVPHFPNRNLDRLSDYHRLDIAATLNLKEFRKNGKKRRAESSWVFSIYNVYARRNAQAYYFRESEKQQGVSVVEKLSVLGTMIPSVTYNFKF
ncbi:TonB-dependent receptor [Reichenbachiella carrageenanivorans]|uniref:TonB-dependent receptor n=1 Tax=Reichenbachiella carrageenanivorans TaxID=2979869 RepID=A0ABY6CZF7_9BACT|nr:TonB-dependent receptor [Reichenbachiella carrageenanivorans]UXX79296.1 TonB-dependent receptor [Reichenbachiella carrageenanivorans]